ncbi:MAG: sugar phosphate isomerase/epimerase family protein [Synechococcaceae cyanobacterium]
MSDPIGLCTWIFGHQDQARIAAEASGLGCAGVELFVDIQAQKAASMRDLFRSHGLRIFSLTPENVDLCHQDGALRQHAIAYYIKLLDYAVAVGAEAVTIHEFVGRGEPHDNPEAEEQRLVETMATLAGAAEQRRVDLLLEPLRPPLVSRIHTTAAAVALCQQVDSPRLKIVLDTFHLEAAERDGPGAIAMSCGRLGAVQLADRQRLALGQGGMDVPAYLAALRGIGFQGPWILECTTGLPSPALQTREVDLAVLRQRLQASILLLQRLLPAAHTGDHQPDCGGQAGTGRLASVDG